LQFVTMAVDAHAGAPAPRRDPSHPIAM
jgi:hypothetical protein